MWADQVSTVSEPARSIRSVINDEPTGYEIEEPSNQLQEDAVVGMSEEIPLVHTPEQLSQALPPLMELNDAHALDDAHAHVVAPQPQLAAVHVVLPVSDDLSVHEIPPTVTNEVPASTPEEPLPSVHSEPSPVTFPASPSVQPISFPGSATEEVPSPPVQSPPPGPAVTFGDDVNSQPKNGTPDPDIEPKRKRISSQNFQRLARRISVTASMARRQASTSNVLANIPGLRRVDRESRDESPRVSTDEPSEIGVRGSTDSPAGSLADKKDKKDKKKDKKRKSTL